HSPRPVVLPTKRASRSARVAGARPLRSARGSSPRDRRAPPDDMGPRAEDRRSGGGNEARHAVVARPDSPLDGQHDGGDDRATQREIRGGGGPAVGPMPDVMALAEASPTAGEATAAVSVVERSPYRRRNRASPDADLHQTPVRVVAHHDPARVARYCCC